ncbi:DUF2529 domain-containing protein [Bacillus sp. DJP31]|uniref:DUF2529 domain-containing protein n=1 Tax=Bacillus sp. DJP31 TaxID=3409789 RepID=UPI003BB717E7
MLKMFTTQLQGVFKKIEEKETMNIEEGARLLSQALIGEGTVYIYGFDELKAVELTATMGPETLNGARSLNVENDLADVTSLDRVLLVTRYSTDPEAIQLAKTLLEKGIPTVAVSCVVNQEQECLHHIVDVHIDSQLSIGLLPDEVGGRFGLPTAVIALYTYYGLYFTIQEILDEYE